MRRRAAARLAVVLALAAPVLAGAALGAFGQAPPSSGSQAVTVHLTSGDGRSRLARRPSLRFGTSPSRARVTLVVDPSQQLQEVGGFGAAFTDSSLWLLSRLPVPRRQAVLRRLLSPTGGIGLSVMRIPMGASDFTASRMYTYDDRPRGQSDPDLRYFSIAHDRAYVLPLLREALRINPHLRFLATPWSPPAWMKTNGSLIAGSPTNGPGRLRPDAYAPLARYFVRFIQAYRAAGVPIWAVTPQNEPLQRTGDYPGMLMSSSEQATFVGAHLGPALRETGLDVRIYGYDYLWRGSEAYVGGLLSGPAGTAAAAELDGIAYHCYLGAPESMSRQHAAHPDKDAIEDECSSGITVLSPIQVLLRSLGNWASVVLRWNVALDPAGGPKIGRGCRGCRGLVTVDPRRHVATYGPEFFQTGQVSAFVRPGARRVAARAIPAQRYCGAAPTCGLEFAAFRNPDGGMVVVASNSSREPVTFGVRRPDGQRFGYSLPGRRALPGSDRSRDASVVTFSW